LRGAFLIGLAIVGFLPSEELELDLDRIRRLRRTCDVVLAVFVLFHLLNHLSLAAGSDVYLLVMSGLRSIYRARFVEPILLLTVAAHVATSIFLIQPRLTGFLARRDWRLVSEIYLAIFLTTHVFAVLWARLRLGLDTNLWFGAAGFHVWPWPLFFVPYYGLAVVAYAAYFGFALKRLTGLNAPLPAAVIGAVVAAAIILLMLGEIVDVSVPEAYLAAYR
jgi:hypothetical protein